MNTKKITINKKKVNAAYCNATEIAFRKYTGVNVQNLLVDLQNGTADPEQVAMLILSSVLSYYQANDKECPISDKDIIYKASAKEITDATVAIVNLCNDWYKEPAGDAADAPAGEEGDPAKN